MDILSGVEANRSIALLNTSAIGSFLSGCRVVSLTMDWTHVYLQNLPVCIESTQHDQLKLDDNGNWQEYF